jgi:hypothetical protein
MLLRFGSKQLIASTTPEDWPSSKFRPSRRPEGRVPLRVLERQPPQGRTPPLHQPDLRQLLLRTNTLAAAAPVPWSKVSMNSSSAGMGNGTRTAPIHQHAAPAAPYQEAKQDL